jgi:hypothetical protein
LRGFLRVFFDVTVNSKIFDSNSKDRGTVYYIIIVCTVPIVHTLLRRISLSCVSYQFYFINYQSIILLLTVTVDSNYCKNNALYHYYAAAYTAVKSYYCTPEKEQLNNESRQWLNIPVEISFTRI